MDVNFIRKLRIAALIDSEGKGGQRKFAEKVGTEASHISNLLNPESGRNVGDDLARRTERAYEMPPGSLDFPDDNLQSAMMKFVLLPDDDRQRTLDFISSLYDSADMDIANKPEKLIAYFKAIAKMVKDREQKRGKPSK